MTRKLLPVNVVAARLSVTERRVRQLINEGKLGAVRLTVRTIKVPEEALQAFLERLNQS